MGRERLFGRLQENKRGDVGIMYETRIDASKRRGAHTARWKTVMETSSMDGPSRQVGVVVL